LRHCPLRELLPQPLADESRPRFDGVDLRAVPGDRRYNDYKGVIGSFAAENRLFFAAKDLPGALQAARRSRRRSTSSR